MNKLKSEKKPALPPVKKKSLFSLMENLFRTDELFKKGIPVEYFPKIMFISGLVIFYIANSHYTEKTIRKIEKLKTETEDLRADFTTQKAEYMYAGKQSEVARKVAAYGLYESRVPPYKIKVDENELEEFF